MMTACLCAILGWAGLLRLAPTGPAPRAIARLASREPARAVPNSVQAEAIRSRDRAVLVLASAGTGKTRVLRTRMAWLLLKQSVPSSSILAVTFSQHAAQQLQARVTAVAGPAAEGAWLGTFHSICWRMLREHHHHLALPPDFRAHAELVEARGGGSPALTRKRAAELLQRILHWKERSLDPLAVPPAHTPRPAAGSADAGGKPAAAERGDLAADSLARSLYPLYQSGGAEQAVFVAADDDQSALLSRSPSLLAKECEPHTPAADAPRVVLRCFWDARDEAQWIARHVAAQRKSHPAYRYSDFAVLVRSQELAAALAPMLRARGLPISTSLPSGLPWWGVPEVATSLAALRLVRSSTDDEAARADGAAAISKLLRLAERCGSLAALLSHLRSLQSGAGEEEGEEDTVQLLTMHRAKGLEWEAGAAASLGRSAAAAPEAEQEEWRLAYVALTRCRRLAAVTYASNRQLAGGAWARRQPSPFVLALPQAHVASSAPSAGDPVLRGKAGWRATTSRLLFPHRQSGRPNRALGLAAAGTQRAWQESPAELLTVSEAVVRAEAEAPLEEEPLEGVVEAAGPSQPFERAPPGRRAEGALDLSAAQRRRFDAPDAAGRATTLRRRQRPGAEPPRAALRLGPGSGGAEGRESEREELSFAWPSRPLAHPPGGRRRPVDLSFAWKEPRWEECVPPPEGRAGRVAGEPAPVVEIGMDAATSADLEAAAVLRKLVVDVTDIARA
ncbi:hypothetical protein EMIHUDRAFT_232826 [Emiliania huxleyi CCMP1516]|uniref:DNA 3'-5' helicase n=2 Tax=Emiliania huxleyi TaxID=2903 RepID=A0A0D3K3Z8_EMIH1|nr:hypothetical protein EMIHUDRAFT_232826 [Emiliania huxleyi CCMP1516]EOD30483.1 hypothetical protein EMIHUDRAFT_232826 [Emiliania huxleyi CCMP1516]|eukprot:XP_005782912.1 hypothetical protein EMIHUDRAFT_232826 [Emiliania huxleyi CCMP1516]